MNRKSWITLGVVASVGGGAIAVAGVYPRVCAYYHSVTAADATGEHGAATGKFDPAMSSVCQFSCSAGGDVDPAMIVAQPGAKDGDLTRCPVSGVVFAVDGERPRVTHDGKTYVLCCGGCEGKFEAEPARFVSAS